MLIFPENEGSSLLLAPSSLLFDISSFLLHVFFLLSVFNPLALSLRWQVYSSNARRREIRTKVNAFGVRWNNWRWILNARKQRHHSHECFIITRTITMAAVWLSFFILCSAATQFLGVLRYSSNVYGLCYSEMIFFLSLAFNSRTQGSEMNGITNAWNGVRRIFHSISALGHGTEKGRHFSETAPLLWCRAYIEYTDFGVRVDWFFVVLECRASLLDLRRENCSESFEKKYFSWILFVRLTWKNPQKRNRKNTVKRHGNSAVLSCWICRAQFFAVPFSFRFPMKTMGKYNNLEKYWRRQ